MTTQDNNTPSNISKWMPLWIGDMRRETIGQPPEFVGMYTNLMMAAWQNSGQLPCEEEQLCRISGADATQWLKHRQALANLFVPGKGMWTHNLIREELDKAYKIHLDRKEAGRAGGVNRWTKARSNAKSVSDSLMAKIANDGAVL
jgi:uncharacterized protein YdaU (DUF1376 family)